MLEAATAAMMTATEPIRNEVLAAFRRAGHSDVEHWFTTAGGHGRPWVAVHVHVGGVAHYLSLSVGGWSACFDGRAHPAVSPTADAAVALLGLGAGGAS